IKQFSQSNFLAAHFGGGWGSQGGAQQGTGARGEQYLDGPIRSHTLAAPKLLCVPSLILLGSFIFLFFSFLFVPESSKHSPGYRTVAGYSDTKTMETFSLRCVKQYASATNSYPVFGPSLLFRCCKAGKRVHPISKSGI